MLRQPVPADRIGLRRLPQRSRLLWPSCGLWQASQEYASPSGDALDFACLFCAKGQRGQLLKGGESYERSIRRVRAVLAGVHSVRKSTQQATEVEVSAAYLV